jgi:dihydroxy-acid dehydratase
MCSLMGTVVMLLNYNQLDLAKAVTEGCKEEGLLGLTFSTIGVSDAITMGTDG